MKLRHRTALAIFVLAIACGRGRMNVEIAKPPEGGDGAVARPEPKDEPVRPGHMSRRYGQVTVRAEVRPELHGELEKLFEAFDELDRDGHVFRAGTKLPLGWTTLTFVPEGDTLVVHEPDYDAKDPEAASRPNLSVSVEILSEQRQVLELAQVEGESIDFDEHVLVERGAFASEQVFMFRVVSPGGRTTGWRITPAADTEGELEVDSMPVHAVLAARPPLMAVLLLPAGFGAVFEGEDLTSVIDPEDHVVWHREGEE